MLSKCPKPELFQISFSFFLLTSLFKINDKHFHKFWFALTCNKHALKLFDTFIKGWLLYWDLKNCMLDIFYIRFSLPSRFSDVGYPKGALLYAMRDGKLDYKEWIKLSRSKHNDNLKDLTDSYGLVS